MAKDAIAHATEIAIAEPVPSELPVGADFVVKLAVSCAAGCDLAAAPLEVTGPDGKVLAIAPAGGEAAAPEAAPREIALKTPQTVGVHVWRIRAAPHESESALHGEAALAVTVRTLPHATSLAVWAVPSPVVAGARFKVTVGAKSSGACTLQGEAIRITDPKGVVLAEGELGGAPWPGTSALYWTELELAAPAQEGLYWCAASFAAAGLDTPHEGSSSRFSVAVVRPPEHRLTVEVLEKESRTPIDDAQIRLGAYRAATDPAGRAEVAMPKGTYDLTVWKVGYDAPIRTIEVQDDLTVQVEAVIVPPENPDAPWIM
jgi:hypothetical protein